MISWHCSSWWKKSSSYLEKTYLGQALGFFRVLGLRICSVQRLGLFRAKVRGQG